MNIEIIEFYPLEHNQDKGILTGTLRVKLCDSGIHILGIHICKRKDSWFFNLPGRMASHHETGKSIRYPFIVFEDREKQRELMEAIREKGRAFIEDRLADTANPLKFSPNPKPAPTPSKQNSQCKSMDSQKKSEEAKPTRSNAIPKNSHSLKPMNFVDPPKRTSTFTRNKYSKSTP